MLDLELQGQKALITGGGTGIGRAIAVALAQEGVDVAIASRNPDPKVIQEIESHGVKGLRLVADVSQEDQVVKMVQDAISGLGGLDLYVNNSAAHWDEAVTRVTTEGWANSMNTNLSACIWACREISNHFIAQQSGSILIIGSVATWNPLYKETGYRVSKSGLVAYLGVLAVELAPFGIRANMLKPGFFPTAVSAHLGAEKMKQVLDGIPLRRAGQPEELAWPAMLLLSDKRSGFTTGAEWVVDGGQTLRPLPFYTDEEIVQMNRPAIKSPR
jgi:3-oxoacyl-[acyl-carrier protein] reductase